ncbi:MAG: hypothetical protein COW03_15970 [Cytophagales bacterium CG12_big_fil_rev_8_21_14_0_65_40_12]|nr:MAG: hypothetical protein COW03_15970 [Cytophagales bacterium CG12_big_fil_rev_8_21_14_0_65_40_12]PIW04950.1 MAG: hypothetical protein COW40_06705 [Cytophagales bacterium CG17_big_fil_post_rev_8_21_14_2_50_40_13]
MTTTINIVNLRGASALLASQSSPDPTKVLFVLLTADSSSGVVGITPGVVTALTDNMAITFDTIKSGRLYVGYGQYPNPPLPQGSEYFGWIEFSRQSTDTAVWINLSNVDILGLPLTLEGTDSAGNAFTLGYKTPMVATAPTASIIAQAKAVLTDGNAAGGSAAVVKTATGQDKILAPNHVPGSYRSYDSYLAALTDTTSSNYPAALSILSDTPANGAPVQMNGNFLNASAATDNIISLTSTDGTQICHITKANLTSQIIYECDGGYMSWSTDGGATFNQIHQNRTIINDPSSTEAERTITNSVFRNIMIGLNEGYFSMENTTNNNSAMFAGLVPFVNGNGNQYAQVIHESSNSYGFPYADSNLKVLVTAQLGAALTLNILADDATKDYEAPSDNTSNQPQSGTYQLGIGSSSQHLGVIKIGNWRYTPNSVGGYGGFLPDLPQWTKMEFTGLGSDKYIWIMNNGVYEGNGATQCLNQPATIANNVVTWGASLGWNGSVAPPLEPID